MEVVPACRATRVLVAFLLYAALVEGFFNVKPKSTNVTVDRLVTFKCGTDQVGYSKSLFFDYVSPPGSAVTPTSFVTLPNGPGTMISVTFIATADLDNTTVLCLVLGKPEHTASAVVRVQNTREVGPCRVCQLGSHIILCWPHISVLDGIGVRYRIVDNLNTNVTVDKPHHSILYNRSTSMHYEARITVILYEVATGYNVQGSETNVIRMLNGKRELIPEQMAVYKDNNTVAFNFRIDPKLSGDDIANCTFHTDLNQDAEMKSCIAGDKNCSNFNATIEYEDGKLNCTCKVDKLRHRFSSSVHFNYAGQEIKTDDINTSTFDIQDVSIAFDCLTITLIKDCNTSEIYFRLESSEGRQFEGNVSIELVRDVCSLYAQNYNISSFVQGNGNWTLQVYDSYEDYKNSKQNPAYELNNITINHEMIEKLTEATATSSGAVETVPIGLILSILLHMLFDFFI